MARKTKMPDYPVYHVINIGSISHGTLLAHDLLSTFATELERLGHEDDLLTEARMYATVGENYHLNEDGNEKAHSLVEELTDALNDYALDYTYFGANEGDGSDFGFWVNHTQLEQAIKDGEVIKIKGVEEWPEGYEGFAVHVNDHGNTTLWAVDGSTYKEVWSVV